jgi:hypothetical protein
MGEGVREMDQVPVYGTIKITPEQLALAKDNAGAFRRLVDAEYDGALRALQDSLYPPFIGPIRKWYPTLHDRWNALRWRVRAFVARPIHWLAQAINPGACERDDDCC